MRVLTGAALLMLALPAVADDGFYLKAGECVPLNLGILPMVEYLRAQDDVVEELPRLQAHGGRVFRSESKDMQGMLFEYEQDCRTWRLRHETLPQRSPEH